MQRQPSSFQSKPNEATLFQYILSKCLIILGILKEPPSQSVIFSLIGREEFPGLTCYAPCIWGTPMGHLRKLHFYYSLIITDQRHPPSPTLLKIDPHISDALLAAQESLFAIEHETKQLDQAYQRLKDNLLTITSLFLKHTPTYGQHIHILFFLLRKHDAFDSLFGKGFTAHIFLSIFSNGLKEASQYLSHCYSEKGYNHLLPFIQKNIGIMKQYES